jgi:hypothetical protein
MNTRALIITGGSGVLQKSYFTFKRRLTILDGAILLFVSYIVNLYHT